MVMIIVIVPAIIVGQIFVTVVQPTHVDAGHIVQVRMRRVVVVVQLHVAVHRETIHRPGLENKNKYIKNYRYT